MSVPTLETIREAAARIAPYATRTPVLTSRTLDEMSGASLFFKCENFQRVGAFKFRGACNAIFSLSDEDAAKGVIAHSSGNHAQALALAAQLRGIHAHIVMPYSAPQVKMAAVADYGAEITYCEPSLAARETITDQLVNETGAVLVHPYNNFEIIAGQATAALELLDEIPELDLVVTPVGGGGLISGTSLAVSGLSSQTDVVGVEPTGADFGLQSLRAGKLVPPEDPDTIADGLLAGPGDKTFQIIRDHVREIVSVDDPSIMAAMRLHWERMKILVEPSAAVSLAALLSDKLDITGKRVGVILTGGNVDLDQLPWMAE